VISANRFSIVGTSLRFAGEMVAQHSLAGFAVIATPPTQTKNYWQHLRRKTNGHTRTIPVSDMPIDFRLSKGAFALLEKRKGLSLDLR